MKVGILTVGQVAPEVLMELEQGLAKTFPETICSVIKEALPLPSSTFDKKRKQYNSSLILNEVRVYASKKQEFHRILSVVDADIFSSGLSYVFGEAYAPGNAALVSLWRLKPEFYGDRTDFAAYALRARKEAVHELGHTLGLKHCIRSGCVMHFSNSIFDTDRKQSFFCDQCYLEASIAITNVR